MSRRADEGEGGGTWHVARETDPVVDAGRWLADLRRVVFRAKGEGIALDSLMCGSCDVVSPIFARHSVEFDIMAGEQLALLLTRRFRFRPDRGEPGGDLDLLAAHKASDAAVSFAAVLALLVPSSLAHGSHQLKLNQLSLGSSAGRVNDSENAANSAHTLSK